MKLCSDTADNKAFPTVLSTYQLLLWNRKTRKGWPEKCQGSIFKFKHGLFFCSFEVELSRVSQVCLSTLLNFLSSSEKLQFKTGRQRLIPRNFAGSLKTEINSLEASECWLGVQFWWQVAQEAWALKWQGSCWRGRFNWSYSWPEKFWIIFHLFSPAPRRVGKVVATCRQPRHAEELGELAEQHPETLFVARFDFH